jgi:hypothetical protein
MAARLHEDRDDGAATCFGGSPLWLVANMCSSIASACPEQVETIRRSGEVDGLSWLVRERTTGKEWRVETSDMAWEAGGYDPRRLEVHVADSHVAGRLREPLEVREGLASTLPEPGVRNGSPAVWER